MPADAPDAATILEPNVNFVHDSRSFTDAGEPWAAGSSIVCQQSGTSTHFQKTFWFKVVGTGGRIVLSTVGSDFDTMIGLYAAGQPPNVASAQLCSDDVRGTLAELTFQSQPGAVYHTQWGGCAGPASCGPGAGSLSYTVLTNDQREHAVPAIDRTHTNSGATVEPSGEDASCRGVPMGRTTWFRWRAPAKGRVSFDVSRFDTVTAVYRAGSAAQVDCNDNAGGDVLRSVVGVDVERQEEVFLQVGGKVLEGTPAEGNFSLRVLFEEDLDLDRDSHRRRPNGPDCDDGNPNIRPGVADVAHNGIDENCDDRDNLDGDGDGQDKAPAGPDCDDSKRDVRFGGREIRGNFVDENCDKRAPAARLDPFPAVSYGSTARLRGRRFGRLTVSNLAAAYRLRISCRGSRRCPRRALRRPAPRSGVFRTTRLARLLPPGTAVEIRVTLPGQNRYGYAKTYRVHGVRSVRVRTCLLSPRAQTPRSCRRG